MSNWRDSLKKTKPFMILGILLLAGCPIVGLVVMLFASIIAAFTTIDPSSFSGTAIVIFLMGMLASVALGIIFLVKKGKNAKFNEEWTRQHQAEIDEENRKKEEEQRKKEEEKRKKEEEEYRRKEERDAAQQQRAAVANASLNALGNPGAAPAAAPQSGGAASSNTSSFVEGTVGELLFELDGQVTSVLQVYADRCMLIAKTNARSYIAGKFFNGTKEFFYEDLTNIQFREATKTFNGYFQFEYPGSVNVGSATFGGTGNNYGSENSFVFSPNCVPSEMRYAGEDALTASNRVASKIYKYIHQRVREEKNANKNVAPQALSTADELEKYHKLLQSGTITQEEFDAKKKQLLGL